MFADPLPGQRIFFLLFAMVGVAKVLSAAKNKKIPAH
jgi:hypothetical protein